MWGLMNAAAEFMYLVNVSLYKFDGFTFGKMLAKVIKVTLQIKLMDYTGNVGYLYDSPAPALF